MRMVLARRRISLVLKIAPVVLKTAHRASENTARRPLRAVIRQERQEESRTLTGVFMVRLSAVQ
jgi:hypothetical protein